MTSDFSLYRAFRLLRNSLEVLALVSYGGAMLASFSALASQAVLLATVRVALFAVLGLVIAQIASVFVDWRWALFGLARALLYLFVIAGTTMARVDVARVTRPNQAMQRTASKAATDALRVCHPRFGCVAGCSGLAVADLVSR